MHRLAKKASWNEYFPRLGSTLLSDTLDIATTPVQLVEMEAGETLYHEGENCSQFIYILEGSLKVQRVTHDGHEITLYHLEPGGICEMTTACLLANRAYHAEARAETPVKAVLFPRQAFLKKFANSPDFQQVIFETLEQGTTTLLRLVEDIAFVAVDLRLANWLIQHGENSDTLHWTHHELAAELGTAREVISRILKRFEHKQWLKLHRGRIDILNMQSIRDFTVDQAS